MSGKNKKTKVFNIVSLNSGRRKRVTSTFDYEIRVYEFGQ